MTYAGLPEFVVVNGTRYALLLDDNIKPAADRKYPDYNEDGESDVSTQEVRVRPGMHPDYAKHISVHEILHLLWEHAGLSAAGGPAELLEEQVVTALARQLYPFLRDNPDFIKFVTGPHK